jgi:hypothetical protein
MTAPNLTALDALIAAVEAGNESAMHGAARRLVKDACDIREVFIGHNAGRTYRGSFDHAIAMYDTILPGHGWFVDAGGTDRQCVGIFREPYVGGQPIVVHGANLARAFSLAILKTYRAQVAG